MKNKALKIESVRLNGITIVERGRVVEAAWKDLPDGFVRDYSDELIRLIDAECDRAYAAYTSLGVTTRDLQGVHAAGHGSWVSSPSQSRQAVWMKWDDLRRAVRKIIG